jgi:hypothetical protein
MNLDHPSRYDPQRYHGRDMRADFELLDSSRQDTNFTQTDTWRVFRIMSEFVAAFEQLCDCGPAVCIFGSARASEEDPYYQLARQTAALFSERGLSVITGGGPGIMEAANRGAYDAGGHSVGLNIELPHEQKPNDYQNLCLQFHYFFVRKVMFLKYAVGFVLFPGGFGTLDEMFESLTLVQTERQENFGVVLFGSEYWNPLVDWMREHQLARGYISDTDPGLFEVTDEPAHAVEVIAEQLHRVAAEAREDAAETRNDPARGDESSR